MKKAAVVRHEIQTSKNQEAKRVAKVKAKKAKKKEEFAQMHVRMNVSDGKEKQKTLLQQLQFRQHLQATKKKPAILGAKKRHFKAQSESTSTEKCQAKAKAKKKFDFVHMRASKCADIRRFITVPGTKEAKLTAEELCKKLNADASELNKPMVWQSTIQANMSLVKKFDSLMEELGEENIPTLHRALMFLGLLKRKNYSVSYISKGLTCLKYHPKLQEEYNDIATHPNVRNALENLRKSTLQTEDNRVPLTQTAIEQFEQIVDNDFSEKVALMVKVALWLGWTCMLQLGELVFCPRAYDESATHTINFNQLDFDEKEIMITFAGWKMIQHRWALVFPYIKGSERKVFNLLTKYKEYRTVMARKDVQTIIINENGTKMLWLSWEVMWHHMVDHSDWVGLNLSGHSMRIGGTTVQHKEGMEILEIMRLGRWQDNTINRYLRPELCQPPENLRKIKHFRSKRVEECHILCNCPKKSEENVQELLITKYQSEMYKKCFKESSTTQRVKILQSHMSERKAEQKRLGTKIPESVRQVKKIADSKYFALPYIKGHVLDSKLIKEQFHGHHFWFTISVYVTRKRWHRFLQTCKHEATRKGDGCPKGNQGTILLSKAKP